MVALTGIQQGVLCEGDARGLGQERGQGDALGLQALVERVKLICGDGVAHAELRNLAQCTMLCLGPLGLDDHPGERHHENKVLFFCQRASPSDTTNPDITATLILTP